MRRGEDFLLWLLVSFVLWGLGPYNYYAGAGFLDPWIATGYFLNFSDLVERYGLLYYVSRLPYILIGVVFYQVFTPVVANFLINVFLMWLACIGLFFATVRLFGRWPATIATVAFATNAYFVATLAWDYPDGPAIAFLLLGLWLALDPPSFLNNWTRGILIGILWCMAGSMNLIAGLCIGPACILVLILSGLRPIAWARDILAILIGVTVAIIVFGLISTFVFGTFWFLGPQIAQFLYALSTPTYLEAMWGSGYGWIERAFRLEAVISVTLLGIISAVLFRTRRRLTRPALGVVALLAMSVALFAFVEFLLNAVVLRVWYTSTYLVAPTFLTMAFILSVLMSDMTSSQRRNISIGLILVLLVVMYRNDAIASWFLAHPRLAWAVVLVPACLVPASFFTSGRKAASVILTTLTCLAAVTLPNLAATADPALAYVFGSSASTFDAAMKVASVLRTGTVTGRSIRFWFDPDEPASYSYHSISSLYLWGWRDLTKELSQPENKELATFFTPQTTLVHLTQMPEKLNQREALAARHGIRLGPRADLTIRANGGLIFVMSLQEVKELTNAP
jgi:hypothetical protein